MAKRKKTTTSDIISAGEIDSLDAMYILFGFVGAAEKVEDFVVPYEYKNSRVSIAIPRIKYGLGFQSDKTTDLEEDGWHIEHISSADLEPFARVFRAIDNARIAKTYALVDPNVKTTSIPEEKIYVELQRRILPIPDRNYKFVREDGTELTTPDFTWEAQKVAFFMDGAYWHSMKSDQEIIRAIKNDKSKKLEKSIIATRKDKVKNDKKIRSELASRGWRVLSCTDDELETPEGVREVVDMIERTLKISEQAASIQQKGSKDTLSLMNSIIASPETDAGGNTAPDSAPEIGENNVVPAGDGNYDGGGRGTEQDIVQGTSTNVHIGDNVDGGDTTTGVADTGVDTGNVTHTGNVEDTTPAPLVDTPISGNSDRTTGSDTSPVVDKETDVNLPGEPDASARVDQRGGGTTDVTTLMNNILSGE